MTPDTSPSLSPEIQQIADQAYFLRGKAIGAYAQIEFVLADMCLQFWEWPAYRHLKGQFPISAAARVEAVTVLFKATGPLAKHWKVLEPLLAQLKSYEKHRHLFAHGHLMLANANCTPTLHFRIFIQSKDGVGRHTENWTLSQMESITSDISAYAGRFGLLLDRIYAEHRLT
ncbi:hypothetical protein [Bradyrhizobium sp. AUGA SZCCT0283]|uniref:hypothetical protein n=1 Tax=Bradyrhizobium sp. AUGA SZCCT0283 TaxID=2807671 RepID=UPI001BAD45EF|nr:hypothetical protein [Bradyrhizobium sp. AUGA SZCCT0283]MBR1276082.1 hypothetical protein [Bradyrhizobium sp. AUGA SZCCT0283]